MSPLHGLRLALVVLAVAPAASANAGSALQRAAPPQDWVLDQPAPPPRRGRAASAKVPASDAAAAKAARLAEGRRKFFESRPDEPESADFGGYDYKRDSGSLRPGAAFKF